MTNLSPTQYSNDTNKILEVFVHTVFAGHIQSVERKKLCVNAVFQTVNSNENDQQNRITDCNSYDNFPMQ